MNTDPYRRVDVSLEAQHVDDARTPNADTLDTQSWADNADLDGLYCEDLPCPCSTATGGDHHGGGSHGDDGAKHKQSCRRPKHVQRLVFSRRKYPHMRIALRHGWPRRLVLNRRGADARRDRLLEHIATREGYDRDEYPPAVGRGRGKGL